MFGVLRENPATAHPSKGSTAMRTVAAIAVAAVTACAVPASADDIKLAPIWPKMSCHAAASLGIAVVGVNVDGDGNSIPLNAQGAIGEVTVGCDARIDNLVVGPFGAYSLSDTDVKVHVDADTLYIGIDDRWTIGVRAGYMTSPDVMVYGKGGYVTAGTDGLTERLDGWMVGGGIETMVTDILGIRLEGDHTRYNGERVGLTDGEADPSETQVKTGVVVKF